MKIDLLFDPFGASWHDIQEGAIAAEGEGFDGVWLYDHLAGSVHGQQRVLECWTTLTAIAATVPRIALGPMVLNVANRHPGTLGVMAACTFSTRFPRACSRASAVTRRGSLARSPSAHPVTHARRSRN